MKERQPGTVREGKIEIFDHQGRPRGHVGPTATAVTVSRFIGQHGAKLGTKNGKPAWLGPKPPPPKATTVDPTAVAVAQEQAKGAVAKEQARGAGLVAKEQVKVAATKSSPSPKQTLEISLRGAKGSVSKPGDKGAKK